MRIVLKRGQVVIEYFLLFAVIALVTVIGLGTTFHKSFRGALERFFAGAVEKMGATPESSGTAENPGDGDGSGLGDGDGSGPVGL